MRKIISWCLVFSLLLANLPMSTSFADLEISTFSIRNIDSGSYTFNPGDTFSLDLYTTNTLSEGIKSTFIKVNFGNNSGFSYQGSDERTRIGGTVISSPVPVSAYSPASGLSYEITDGTTTTIAPGTNFDFTRASNSQVGFLVSPTIGTYENDLTAGFEAQKSSDGSAIIGAPTARVIYVNVKPHIADYYFEKADASTTTNQIQGSQTEAINLVLRVKDYNGCPNIAGGTVTADLSALGLNTSEPLAYLSCDADGKTAIFKKTGITTLAALGDKTFMPGSFSATDMDGNISDSTDPRFSVDDKKSNLSLTVVPPAAPTVILSSVSERFIGGSQKPSTILSFSGSQNGEIKAVANGDGNCASGTVLSDWTGSGSYVAYSDTGITVNANTLNEGTNSVTICEKSVFGIIGSVTTDITKDTTPPVIQNISISPANVILNNSVVSFKCSEDGIYQVELSGSGTPGSGTFVGSGNTIASAALSQTVLNTALINGANPVSIYCIDKASNTAVSTNSIHKTPPTPSMAGAITSFSDADNNYDGLDGRDMTLAWGNSAVNGFDYFESYRLYLLPAAVSFSAGSQTYVALLPDKTLTSWTGDASIKKDSLGNTLISGSSYKMCIAMMARSGMLGTESCSGPATLTADIVTHPTILSARFTTDTSLELITNATLDSVLSSHSGALVTYQVGSNTFTGISVASVDASKITFIIPALGNLAATGSNLIVQTGALHANGGGFNNYFSSGSFIITDGQPPVISGFSNTTSSPYNNFFKGTISLTYTFSESMSGKGDTNIVLTHTSGNPDGIQHIINLTAASDLAVGSHTKSINLDTLGLVSGSMYSIQLVGKDVAGNRSSSAIITNIGYDNNGPVAPKLVKTSLFSTLTPALAWIASLDDAGHGSGIKKYVLQVFSSSTCGTGSIQTYPNIISGATSQTLTALPTDIADYGWNLVAIDNLDNTGSVAICNSFRIDTTIPAVSNQKITNQTLNSALYVRDADALQISATIPNSDTNHIWIDASSLAGSPAYNHVSCASPSGGIVCTYSSNKVTYTFLAGFAGTTGDGVRQVILSAQNISGGNNQSAIASITADNTAPAIPVGTLITPNGGETWSGTTQSIQWNPTAITDAVGVKDIVLEYATGAGTWNSITTLSNSGSYLWNIASLADRNDYKVRLTAEDFVGHQTSLVSGTSFLIDKTAPIIVSGSLLVPSVRNIYAGGQTLVITWNPSGITDTMSLATNPITLEYSTDTGTTWLPIAGNIPNSGSYNWTLPSLNAESVFVQLTARDIPGNTAKITSGASIIIDSTNPVQTITYAGSGGSTVPTNGKINSSGFDLSLSSLDAHLASVSYQFANTIDSSYWSATSTGWTNSNIWNSLCTDAQVFGTDGTCSNINTTLIPTIVDGKSYTLIIRSTDEAGNTTTSITHHYTGDTVGPVLSVNPVSTSYVSGNITFTGSASDTGSLVSSVKVQIQKGAQYWDGTTWVATPQSLLVSTSDNYANWNYTFTPLLADTDGQNYVVTFTAYDSAYKINNSTNISRTIIKDITGPAIDPNVFTFSTGGIYKGNANFTITWNSAAITTSGATLATNPIDLFYNFTGSVINIAHNIPNTGSYSFALPVVDSTSARIIMSASDILGNVSSNVPSSIFTIDSIPPSVQSVQTLDQAASGKIDGLLVHFSEKVQNIDPTAFQIDSGSIAITGWSWGGIVGNQDAIVLDFSATGTTASTPTLSYTASGGQDIAGNPLVAGSKIATDGAAPRIVSAQVFDTDSNGKIDDIKITFSENLSPTNILAGWTLATSLPGLTIISANASGNMIDLKLNESSAYSTDTFGDALSLVNSTYIDPSGNLAGGFSNQPLIDKAPPILLSARTQDVNANNKIDSILATFSESLTGTTTGWTVGNLASGSTFTGGVTLSGNTLSYAIRETNLSSDSGQIPTLSYVSGGLSDIVGNTLSNIPNQNVSDGIAPRIVSRSTRDADGNGKIDSIKLTFAENIDDNTSGFNLSVAGYTVTGFDTTCDGSTANDNILCVRVSENVLPDSGNTPMIQILTNTSLADVSGNLLPIDVTGTTAIDAIGPVITTARYEQGSPDKIYLTFSENLSGTTLSVNPAMDFIVGSGGSLGTSSTQTLFSPDTIEISLGSDAVALTPGVSTLAIASGSLTDTLGNFSPAPNPVNTVIVSPTILINEVMWSNTGANAYQYIELHNPNSTSTNITGWKIKNAGGDGTTLIIPVGSIPANGYYLIAHTDSTGPLNVNPDYVAPSLALSQSGQNNLILMNGNQTIDNALANSWPYGNTNLPTAMERNIAPGNGLNILDWHAANTSVGFDAGLTALGTPGSVNALDGTPPTIGSASMADNTLFPIGTNITLDYAYSDNIAVNPTLNSLSLAKWNGSTYIDVTPGSISTSGATLTGATYTFNTLSFGKYRALFNIVDTSGNPATKTTIFYVDKFEMTVSTGSTDIGTINSSTTTYAPDVTVTIKTLGAGFDLTLGGSGAMNAGINTLSSWSGATGDGFGFDYSESGSGGSIPFIGVPQSINPTSLTTYATGSIDADGLQKTYIYTVRYGAKIASSQAAGNYVATTLFGVTANY